MTLDIRDFFPSTSIEHVYWVFTRLLGIPKRWAAPLTQLTTRQHRLPQGAPSSSYLSHLALLPSRNEIAPLCHECGVVLTAYMDDLAFSGRRVRAPRGYIDQLEAEILTCAKHGGISPTKQESILGKIRHVERLCVPQADNLMKLFTSLDLCNENRRNKAESKWERCCCRSSCRGGTAQ